MTKVDIIKDEINNVASALHSEVTSAHSKLKNKLNESEMDDIGKQIIKASRLSKKLLKLVKEISAKNDL
jgi:hypothetical protein